MFIYYNKSIHSKFQLSHEAFYFKIKGLELIRKMRTLK